MGKMTASTSLLLTLLASVIGGITPGTTPLPLLRLGNGGGRARIMGEDEAGGVRGDRGCYLRGMISEEEVQWARMRCFRPVPGAGMRDEVVACRPWSRSLVAMGLRGGGWEQGQEAEASVADAAPEAGGAGCKREMETSAACRHDEGAAADALVDGLDQALPPSSHSRRDDAAAPPTGETETETEANVVPFTPAGSVGGAKESPPVPTLVRNRTASEAGDSSGVAAAAKQKANKKPSQARPKTPKPSRPSVRGPMVIIMPRERLGCGSISSGLLLCASMDGPVSSCPLMLQLALP